MQFKVYSVLMAVLCLCLPSPTLSLRGALYRAGRSVPDNYRGYISQDFLRFGRSAPASADSEEGSPVTGRLRLFRDPTEFGFIV